MESDYSTYLNIHTGPLSSTGQPDPHYTSKEHMQSCWIAFFIYIISVLCLILLLYWNYFRIILKNRKGLWKDSDPQPHLKSNLFLPADLEVGQREAWLPLWSVSMTSLSFVYLYCLELMNRPNGNNGAHSLCLKSLSCSCTRLYTQNLTENGKRGWERSWNLVQFHTPAPGPLPAPHWAVAASSGLFSLTTEAGNEDDEGASHSSEDAAEPLRWKMLCRAEWSCRVGRQKKVQILSALIEDLIWRGGPTRLGINNPGSAICEPDTSAHAIISIF